MRVSQFNVLLVCQDQQRVKQVRQGLIHIGISKIQTPKSKSEIIESNSHFSHIIFEFEELSDHTKTFVQKILLDNPDTTLIALANKIDLESLLEMLRLGVRGFLLMPFSNTDLEKMFKTATAKNRISDVIFGETDTESTLSEGVTNILDRLAHNLSEARHNPLAATRAKDLMIQLREAVEIGIQFSSSGEDGFQAALMKTMVDRAYGRGNRLRRTRDHLNKIRKKERRHNFG